MNLEERFKKIVEINGKEFQFQIAVEECAEFIQAVQKYKRGRDSLDHVLEEMADVLVTFGCLKEALDDEKLYTDPNDFIMQEMDRKTKWAETYKGTSKDPVTWQSTGA